MKPLVIIILMLGFITILWRVALPPQEYLIKKDGHWWVRDTAVVTGFAQYTVSTVELPFIIAEYWLFDREALRQNERFFEEHIAGTDIETANKRASAAGYH